MSVSIELLLQGRVSEFFVSSTVVSTYFWVGELYREPGWEHGECKSPPPSLSSILVLPRSGINYSRVQALVARCEVDQDKSSLDD
jgi:hypothetical protein